jgi:hypothetical protein
VTHPVNDIAEAIVALLRDETCAEDRVFRDREPDLQARSELPAIVVHIGSDDPVDQQMQTRWRSEVRINVDLFTTAEEERVSSALLDLRAETYRLLMANQTLGLPGVIRILPGGAEEILRSESAIPIGFLRTVFFVLYQHSLTDPSQ